MKGFLDRYDLFIFDWDGTLTEIKLMNRVNERLNFLWLKKKERSKRAALYNRRQVARLEAKEAKEIKEYKSLIDVLMLLARPKLQPYTVETLKLLKKGGKRVVLFSNGAYWRVAKEAKNLGVMGYFDFLLSGQDIEYVKPHPLGLNIILQKEKVRGKKALYIGDMADDVLTARLAHIDCAAVYCGFDTARALASEKPRYLFKDIRGLYGGLHG